MSHVRIMTDNFLDTDIVSTATVSSEQTAFPVSNAYNLQRRSKVWRSNGYFDVTASNNTIIFRETTGVDLTATLVIDEYLSRTLLCAAIKTALEAVGASTYTVSIDTTTSKFKIVSNGVGGGGIFQLRWTQAGSAGMASLIGYDTSADDTGGLTYLADELKIHSSEWLKWDMGISTNPKAFVLIGARNKPIAITPSAVLTLQGSETDNWTTPSYTKVLTYNDYVISEFSILGLHTEALRYWRLLIQDSNNSNGYVEIGALFLGDFTEPVRGSARFPFSGRYIDRSITSYSEGGQTFSDIREQTEEFSIEWFGLTIAEKEDIDYHFSKVGTNSPFFVQFDPDAAFSSIDNYYLRYVKYSSEPSYQLVSPGVYTLSMDMREEL